MVKITHYARVSDLSYVMKYDVESVQRISIVSVEGYYLLFAGDFSLLCEHMVKNTSNN